MQPETKQKKRVLKDIDFSNDGAHIALCHKDQGVANMSDFALVIKAQNFSDEFIEKLQTIKVELELPDFIQRFWKIEEEKDAKALAFLMGWKEDAAKEAMEPEVDFQDWVASNMLSFEIVKALKDSSNYAEVLSELEESQYLSLLKEQETFERNLKKLEADKQEKLAKAEQERRKPKVKQLVIAKKEEISQSDTNVGCIEKESASEQGVDANTSTVQHEVNKGKGVNPVVKQSNKEKSMDKVTVVEQTLDVEMVEKSQFETIQKQFKEQQEQLQKALATVAKFEQEKKEQISKQRLADIEAAVKNKEHALVLHKALVNAEDDNFIEVVKALAAISLNSEQNDLFVEKSMQVEEKPMVEESAVARLIKAKFQAK